MHPHILHRYTYTQRHSYKKEKKSETEKFNMQLSLLMSQTCRLPFNPEAVQVRIYLFLFRSTPLHSFQCGVPMSQTLGCNHQHPHPLLKPSPRLHPPLSLLFQKAGSMDLRLLKWTSPPLQSLALVRNTIQILPKVVLYLCTLRNVSSPQKGINKTIFSSGHHRHQGIRLRKAE